MTATPDVRDFGRLIGRADDLRALASLLESGARWVTLVGLGGVGKSRLAHEAASRFSASQRASITCECVGIQSSDELAIALAGKVARIPSPVLELERDLTVHLRALGPVTVVLDHLEHLVAKVGPLVRRLLSELPDLVIVGTSRLPFELPQEVVFSVLPLDAEGVDSPSATLLRALARGPRALPEWERDAAGVAQLARRLDGIPLAIELAAARSHLTTPRELEALLDLRFSLEQPTRDRRQSTRDVAIEWAWSRLSDNERAALGRLSILAGTFDLELALALIVAPRAEAFALFEQLARYSLVLPATRPEGARYRVLETVRELALSRLGEGERRAAMADMGTALLARFPTGLDPLGLSTPHASLLAAQNHDHLLTVLRNGPDLGTPKALADALRAGAFLIARFRRSGCEMRMVEMVKEVFDLAECDGCPTEVMLAAGIPIVLTLANRGESHDIDGLLERLERCAGADVLSVARVRVVRAVILHLRWDYRGVEACVRALADSPIVADEPLLSAMLAQNELVALRALGRVDAETAERRLAAATAGLEAAGMPEEALRCRINRIFLATHLGRPDLALGLVTSAEVTREVALVQRFAPYLERERARAEGELGLRRDALTHFDSAMARFGEQGPSSTQTIETVLDRAAVAIEAGDYEGAHRDLVALNPMTVFARGYRDALLLALGALSGLAPGVMAGTSWQRIDSVEDEALRLWRMLVDVQRAAAESSPLPPMDALASDAAPFSFRVRQAQRMVHAAHSIAGAAMTVVAVSVDRSAFQLGGLWHELTTAPLLRLLVSLVTSRALEGEPGIGKDALADALWAGERMTMRSRSKRLGSALAALAERGLQLTSEGDHVMLPPGTGVVVLAPALWPGLGTLQPRGRGRPRKTTGRLAE